MLRKNRFQETGRRKPSSFICLREKHYRDIGFENLIFQEIFILQFGIENII